MTPLERLRSQGVNAYVGRLLDRDFTEQQIRDDLTRRWPGETQRTYDAAYQSGIDAASAGDYWQAQSSTRPLLLGDIPAGTGTAGGVRWYIVGLVLSSKVPEGETRSIVVVSDGIPTEDELTALIDAQLQQMYGGPPSLMTYGPFGPTVKIGAYEVIAVERAG